MNCDLGLTAKNSQKHYTYKFILSILLSYDSCNSKGSVEEKRPKPVNILLS